MSSEAPNRTCGNCGAPVGAAAETCPRCSALLAAYDVPTGASDAAIGTTPSPAAPVPPLVAPAAHAAPAPHRAPVRDVTSAQPPSPGVSTTGVPPSSGPPPHRAEQPRRQAPAATPPATGEPQAPLATPARQRPAPAPAREPSSRQIASTVASFARLGLGVLMILVVVGILDFDLVPILVLGVVMLSLLGLMRSAAKASGRKTTTMHKPGGRDPWRK